jgi:hypothetical protein
MRKARKGGTFYCASAAIAAFACDKPSIEQVARRPTKHTTVQIGVHPYCLDRVAQRFLNAFLGNFVTKEEAGMSS